MKYLVVNADDLGLSTGVNRDIAEAVEHGIVTSTSLMVRWPASEGGSPPSEPALSSAGGFLFLSGAFLRLDVDDALGQGGETLVGGLFFVQVLSQ